MDNQKILKLLLSKADKNELGHFYHLKLHGNADEESFQKSWLTPFLVQILKLSKESSFHNLINNPDFLLLGRIFEEGQLNSYKNSDYTLEEIMPFIQFNNESPWQAPYKISVIFDAERLNSIVSNKLLKTLEEPNKQSLIFLINSTNASLLPTIHSRAITIRLAPFSKDEELDTSLLDKSLPELVNLQKNTPLDDTYLKLAIKRQLALKDGFHSSTKLLELTRWFNKSKLFNNSSYERLSRLYLFDKPHH